MRERKLRRFMAFSWLPDTALVGGDACALTLPEDPFAARAMPRDAWAAHPRMPITSSFALSPLVDFALDRFGHVGAQQLADVQADRLHELGARAVDDRLQPLVQLVLEASVGENVDPLQYL